MSWFYLNSTTLSRMPNVLAGPILRKVTSDSVTVWFALKRKATVTLKVMDAFGSRLFDGPRDTIAIGKNLHIVAVTAAPKGTEPHLVENAVYLYDATFVYAPPTGGNPPTPPDSSIAAATRDARLAYKHRGYDRPSFCLPPKSIFNLRILHGSCRKAAGSGVDALAIVDTLIEEKANAPLQRPHQLLLNGDQIYADDVAPSLLVMLTDAASFLLGWDEELPIRPSTTAIPSALPPFSRRRILKDAKFTSVDLHSHLLSLGEYLCMYLFAWSDVLWPPAALAPKTSDVMDLSAIFHIGKKQKEIDKIKADVEGDIQSVIRYRATLANVRCALANIPCYMTFDDHEVTDDWNMTEYTAFHLYKTEIGQRVVQNALVAYSLCQHWGNVPEQFLKDGANLPGTKLLNKLDSISTSADYTSKSLDIRSLVNVPVAAEVEQNLRVDHRPGSLTYNYTIEGDAHQVIMTDTRTWRAYPHGVGGEPPDLLTKAQFAAQIVNTPPLAGRLLIVVLSTNAPPIQPIRTATRLHPVSNRAEHFPDINEAWDIPSIAFDRLIKALSDKVGFSGGASGKVVLLSGDVHMGFASRLHYKATKRFEDSGTKHANMVVAQLVASAFKKQDSATISLQRDGYRYAPHHSSKAVPPHRTEYYVGWDVQPSGPLTVQNMGNWGGLKDLVLEGASSIQLPLTPIRLTVRWKQRPPDFSYQLDYLTMTNGGIPKTLQPLPAPPTPKTPGAPTDDELNEAAHLLRLASDNYRVHNLDPAVVRHLIGVNNMGDLTFPLPPAAQTGPFIVNHRLRFRSPDGLQLFVDYGVNMESVDSDHPADPNYFQVTP